MGIIRKIGRIIRGFIYKDEALRLESLREVARLLLPNYRFSWPYLSWWNDPFLNTYLKRFDEENGMNMHRRLMLYQLMRTCAYLEGDTVECGVFKGVTSYLMCKMNKEKSHYKKTHHIFDSFEGVSTPSKEDGKFWIKGDKSCGSDEVKKNLKEFENISYHKGWIPDKFSDISDKKFSFVHIDVDLYAPTLECMKFFYPRMVNGGIILCDDYGFTICPGTTKAIDEFLREKCEKMLYLSGGGGFFIKDRQIADQITF